MTPSEAKARFRAIVARVDQRLAEIDAERLVKMPSFNDVQTNYQEYDRKIPKVKGKYPRTRKKKEDDYYNQTYPVHLPNYGHTGKRGFRREDR